MAAIYIFSGLGTDERVFQYIDLSGFAVHYIQWITPFNDEPLADYAKRLSTQIHHRKPVFVGVSFGGMMAMEVAKYIAADKIILLASAKTKHEIPFYYRLAGSLQLYKILPYRFIKNAVPVKSGGHFMTVNKASLLTELLRNILSSTNIPS